MATPVPGTQSQAAGERLDSWKQIADHLKRDVRTVQRWEKKEGLPVHRLVHGALGTVYAYKSELDAWWTRAERRVVEDDSAAAAAGVQPGVEEFEFDEQAFERQERASRRGVWFITKFVGTAILVLSLPLFWLARHRLSPSKPASGLVRLMVLPLDNLSGDPSQNYFSQGMTEELCAQLAKFNPRQMAVIARNTAERYKDKPIDQIGRDLSVDYVIEGSVRREAQRVRVTVQLIDTKAQTHLWAKSYEEEMRDVLSLQRSVANEIADEVHVQLVHGEVSSIGAAPTSGINFREVNPDAYDLFLQGKYFWNLREPGSVPKAIGLFQQTIQKDPKYAPAYSGLADAYALLGSAQIGALPPKQAFPQAKAFAQRALALDDSLGEAHASLAYILLVYDRDWPAAEREFNRAIELNPGYPLAHQWLGLYYESLGRFDEAIATVKRARELDPLALPANIALIEAYYFARRYNQAIEQGRKTVELYPNAALAHFNLGRAYQQQQMYKEALAEFTRARELAPKATTLPFLGYAQAMVGERDHALNTLALLRNFADQGYVPAIYRAVIYTGLKDDDNAFFWLNRAYDEHCDYLVFLNQDPMADNLRSDPRFAELIRRIGL